MKKLIDRIRLSSAITILVELLIVSAFCIIYFLDLIPAITSISVVYIIIGACVLVLLNCVFVWAMSLRVSRLRRKTDLKAAEVIGSDIQAAYDFAEMALVITDDDGMVLWTNDLFPNRHINLIDSNIYTWQPSLEAYKKAVLNNKEPAEPPSISAGGRTYLVKFLPEAGLWIFKDNFKYQTLYDSAQNSSPVIGVLSIDNYEEIVRGDDEQNDVITDVKNIFFAYFRKYKVLLKKIKDGRYDISCTYENLVNMRKDGFKVINEVKSITYGEGIKATLSIGLSYDETFAFGETSNNTLINIGDNAESALKIAIARGGDQIVISCPGKDMEFIGGKTEAQQKQDRVKTRLYADSLFKEIQKSSIVYVQGHRWMDMDAFGACLGIKAIADRFKVPCKIIVDLKQTEPKTKNVIQTFLEKDEIDDFIIAPGSYPNNIDPKALLVVVDVHIANMTMDPKVFDKINTVAVIDHHRRGEEYILNPVFDYIDSSASSTSEILAEYMKFSSLNPIVDLPSRYATVMLSGIFLDSAHFKSTHTGISTFEAASVLREYGADNAKADAFLQDDFEEYFEVIDIVKSMKTAAYGVVYCNAGDRIYDQTTFAKAANTCLSLKGNNASFVFGKIANHKYKMSCRSDGTINVQLLAEKMGGGGHFTMSSCEFNDVKDPSYVEKRLLETIRDYLNDAKADAKSRIGDED